MGIVSASIYNPNLLFEIRNAFTIIGPALSQYTGQHLLQPLQMLQALFCFPSCAEWSRIILVKSCNAAATSNATAAVGLLSLICRIFLHHTGQILQRSRNVECDSSLWFVFTHLPVLLASYWSNPATQPQRRI
jgi:hypothetical protein